MIFSPIVFREKMTGAKLLGFLAVIIGMLCVNGDVFSRQTISWGLVCGLLSAVMYAFMVIFNKKAVGIKGLENPMWQLIISFLTVAVFLGFETRLFNQQYLRESIADTDIGHCEHRRRLLFLFFLHPFFLANT